MEWKKLTSKMPETPEYIASIFIRAHNWDTNVLPDYHERGKHSSFENNDERVLSAAVEICISQGAFCAASDLASSIFVLNKVLSLKLLKRLSDENCYCAYVYANFLFEYPDDWVYWMQVARDGGHIRAKRRLLKYFDELGILQRLSLRFLTYILLLKDYKDIRTRNWMRKV